LEHWAAWKFRAAFSFACKTKPGSRKKLSSQNLEAVSDFSGAGFSLWIFVPASSKFHRLNPGPPKSTQGSAAIEYLIVRD
jgi:hypothetical protein